GFGAARGTITSFEPQVDSSFSRSYRKSQSNYPRGLPRSHGAQNTEPRVMSFRFIIYRRTHMILLHAATVNRGRHFKTFLPIFRLLPGEDATSGSADAAHFRMIL